MIFRVRNVPTWIGIAFGKIIVEVELKQSTAIFKSMSSIKFIFLLVSEMENKYSGTLLQLKG
jgi:hypothetical protein